MFCQPVSQPAHCVNQNLLGSTCHNCAMIAHERNRAIEKSNSLKLALEEQNRKMADMVRVCLRMCEYVCGVPCLSLKT